MPRVLVARTGPLAHCGAGPRARRAAASLGIAWVLPHHRLVATASVIAHAAPCVLKHQHSTVEKTNKIKKKQQISKCTSDIESKQTCRHY